MLDKKEYTFRVDEEHVIESCSVVSTIGFFSTLPTVLMAISNLDSPRAALRLRRVYQERHQQPQTVNGT